MVARQKVLQAAQTHAPAQIARLLAMSRTTLYSVLARYRAHGLNGLADQSRRMDTMTPWHKLNCLLPQIQPHIAAFPPLLLDPLASACRIPAPTPNTVQ